MRPLWIERVGAVTSVGLNAGQTMGALLTLTSRPQEIGLRHPHGEPVSVRAAPIDTGMSTGVARLVAMMQLALGECTEDALPEPLPLVLACPSTGAFAFDADALLRATVPLGDAVDRGASKVIAGGEHTAIGSALSEAGEAPWRRGAHRACYVRRRSSTLLDLPVASGVCCGRRVSRRAAPRTGSSRARGPGSCACR